MGSAELYTCFGIYLHLYWIGCTVLRLTKIQVLLHPGHGMCIVQIKSCSALTVHLFCFGCQYCTIVELKCYLLSSVCVVARNGVLQ